MTQRHTAATTHSATARQILTHILKRRGFALCDNTTDM